MFEKRLNKTLAAVTLCVGIGGAACAGGAEAATKPIKTSAHHSTSQKLATVPEVKVTYFSNGSRLEQISEPLDVIDNKTQSPGYSNFNTINTSLVNIFDFCDGPDLVETVESAMTFNGTATPGASTTTRFVNYAACNDGRLTPSDFKNSPAEQIESSVGPPKI